ncbi:hypothetical protein [Sedimenticola sp.]|uniref:hypothetical protein n=1 Tax=Sedimenticola sp. TaxID=1940285 RepID=UPI003D0CF61C
MKTLLKLTLASVLLLSITACVEQSVRDPSSRFYRIPVGSHIVLHQALAIKAGHVRQFVQRGAATDFSDLDQYWPSCSFEVRELRQTPQQIQPDNFEVVRVQQGETQIVGQPRLQVAGLKLIALSLRETGQPLVSRYYDIWLKSDTQPNVMRMRCFGAMADLSESELPLFMEIQEALGAIASVEL